MEQQFHDSEAKTYALEHISGLLSDNRHLMERFNKKHYADAFTAYAETSKPVLDAAEQACLGDEANRTALLNELVAKFLADTEKEVSSLGRCKQKNHLETSKLLLALYTVPMIIYQKNSISEELAELLVASWSQTYPQHSFLKGTYEELLDGFQITRPPFMGLFRG